VAIGLLIIAFLWYRPRGTLPEPRRVFGDPGPARPSLPRQRHETREPAAAADRGQLLLRAEGVERRFEGLRAVDGVSIAVEAGRITGLIGPNGAGKSTLLAVLAGTLPPSAGRIFLDGRDVTGLPAYQRARRGLARTFQLSSEFAHLTVMENLLVAVPRQPGDSLLGALRGKSYWGADERFLVEGARELLARFRMSATESAYAGDLSGGQKRLVEIMRALMLRPRVLLLDEPMAGVHPSVVEEIASSLESLRQEGLAIMMVEHELSMVDRLCDPVIVMAQGKIIGRGSMSSLRRQREIVDAYLVG
jgi:ABC-type branched-subunit amino acid transport system ATPase component